MRAIDAEAELVPALTDDDGAGEALRGVASLGCDKDGPKAFSVVEAEAAGACGDDDGAAAAAANTESEDAPAKDIRATQSQGPDLVRGV